MMTCVAGAKAGAWTFRNTLCGDPKLGLTGGGGGEKRKQQPLLPQVHHTSPWREWLEKEL